MIVFIYFVLLFQLTLTNNIYCYPLCAATQCTGTSYNNCLNCNTPLTLSSNQCQLSANYQIQASTSSLATSSGTFFICGTNMFNGNFTSTSQIQMIYTGPISKNHHNVILVFGIVLFSDWMVDTDKVYVQLGGSTNQFNIESSTKISQSTVCNGSSGQYVQIWSEFVHSDVSNSLSFNISILSTNNGLWAIKDYLLLIQVCHMACEQCNDLTNTSCSLCTTGYKLSGTICHDECMEGYGETSNILQCILCYTKCKQCEQIATNCSICISPALLYGNQCLDQCPKGYFPYIPQLECLDCATYCINASLKITEQDLDTVVCEICFSDAMDFVNIDLQGLTTISINQNDLNMAQDFKTIYQIKTDRCYQIKVSALSFASFQNLQITFSINQEPRNGYYSINGYKLSPDFYQMNGTYIWTYASNRIQQQDKIFYSAINQMNNAINQALSLKGIQQLKKTGIFALLLPGALLSSILLLFNNVPPANMYQGMRFWGSFIYFEVPQWQQSGKLSKYVFSEQVNQIINKHSIKQRLLQSSQNQIDTFRFQRVGYTNIMLIDCYMLLIIVAICWVIILFTKIFRKYFSLGLRSALYSLVHRFHQICTFYLFMSAILDMLVFNTSNSLRYSSLIISIITIIYLLVYVLYIFYMFIPFPSMDVCSEKYDDYVQKYGYFLRDLKYTQPMCQSQQFEFWNFRHLIRPYNYQILSYYRLILFVSAIPLFQDFEYGAQIILLLIQTIEIIRLVKIRPYQSRWRNIFKIILELVLLLCLLVILIEFLLYKNISQNQTIHSNLGWFGFSLFFCYNIAYLLYFIIDTFVGCVYTNKQRMSASISRYCSQKFKITYTFPDRQPTGSQEQLQAKNIILRGNLLQHTSDKEYKVSQKIQSLKVIERDQQIYSVQCYIVKDIFLDLKPLKLHKSNIVITSDQSFNFNCRKNGQNSGYYQVFSQIFAQYGTKNDNIGLLLQTYMLIDQSQYKSGQQILMDQTHMFQQIYIVKDRGVVKDRLQGLLSGFPIPHTFFKTH